MRRLLLLVALLVVNAAPAHAEIVWWNEPPLPYSVQPITFIDTVIGTVQTDRVAAWRVIRDQALNEWGIPHVVGEDMTNAFSPFDDAVTEERNGISGVIRIGRNVSSVCQNYGGWYGTIQGGVAVVCLMPLWWKDYRRTQEAAGLGHEVGHAFGLGHSSTGIMSGAYHVSAEERLVVQGFYG